MVTAEQAKSAGMSDVEAGANPEWMRAAYEAVLATARECRHFTSDEVMGRIPEGVGTHDKRALGPVVRTAAFNGVIEKAPVPAVNSARRSLHASPRTVWKSLIFKEGHASGKN
jgi:hypothetical protein